MSLFDIILIGLSILGFVLSLLAVCLVSWGLREKRKTEARERAPVELSMEELCKSIAAAKAIKADGREQIIRVKGKRKRQNPEFERGMWLDRLLAALRGKKSLRRKTRFT